MVKTENQNKEKAQNEDVRNKSKYINYYNLKRGLDMLGLKMIPNYTFGADYIFKKSSYVFL